MNSSIIAKLMVRLFFLLLIIALVAMVHYQERLKRLGAIRLDQWRLAYPALLVLGFVILLVLCVIKKYKSPDINWLLIINTIMLIVYGMAIFFRIAQMVA